MKLRALPPLFLSLALATTQTLAQSRPAPRSEASAHFERGTTFYAEGDYSAALVEFKRAYELAPTFQVLFNIGQSYFQLRDYANALTTLQRFADEGRDRIGKDDRATLDAELPDLTNRVARATITSNLDGATVSIDDQVVGTTPLASPVLVSAGSRRITASFQGRETVERRVPVGGGDALTVRLDFPPVSAPSAPSPHAPTRTAAQTTSPNYLPAYVGWVVGAAGVAVGSIFGAMALDDKSTLDRSCTAAGACPANSQHPIDVLSRDSTLSTVGFGLGLVGLATGTVLWLTARGAAPSGDARPPGAALVDTPARLRIGPGFVAGRF